MLNGFSQSLQNPAGKSESINSYMRLVMNLMKVYDTGERNKDMVRKHNSMINIVIHKYKGFNAQSKYM